MSGKKNKRGFDDEDEKEDEIGFRDPSRVHGASEHPDKDAETDADEDMEEDDAEDADDKDDDDEDDFDDEERGWHTFDMDNPDESL